MRKRDRRRNKRKKDEKAPQEKYKAKNERNIGGRKKTEGWEQESVRGGLGGAGGEFGGKRMEVDEERGMGK